jgi:hypothetical protein
MGKRLACWLGRHEWTTRVVGGESYKVCAACGKSPREPGPPGQGQQADAEGSGGRDFGGAAGGGDGG